MAEKDIGETSLYFIDVARRRGTHDLELGELVVMLPAMHKVGCGQYSVTLWHTAVCRVDPEYREMGRVSSYRVGHDNLWQPKTYEKRERDM